MTPSRQLVLPTIFLIALVGCRQSDTSNPPDAAGSQGLSALQLVQPRQSSDSLVLWFCGESGRIGFDVLGPADTILVYHDQPRKFVWNGAVDSMTTPMDGALPLYTIDLPCRLQPFGVAVRNPTSDDFKPIELDTLPDAATWLAPEILAQARSTHPDTVPQGDGPPYLYDFYRFPPRAYRERGTTGDPLVLQYGCDSIQRCGPLFRVVGRKLSALRGGTSDGPPVLFRHGGRMHLYLSEGLGEGGDVWLGIHRFDADTITTLAIDGRSST